MLNFGRVFGHEDGSEVEACHPINFSEDNPQPPSIDPSTSNYRLLKGPGGVQGQGGCSWGSLRIPFGKIGEP